MAWLSGWDKRKKITLTGGSSGSQTNYQIKLTVTHDADMQADFDDLRFTKSDGTTLVNAWLESKTNSTTATVWVEFPTTPANTVTEDYYMYYGNSGASSIWNITNTFIFGDDFPGTSLDTTKWDTTNSPVISGGKAKFSDITDLVSKNTYDFDRSSINIISNINYINVGSNAGQSTFINRTRDRNAVLANVGGGWYPEGTYDRRYYGVAAGWWAGTGKGAATGYNRQELKIISPSTLKWKSEGTVNFDDSRTDTNNYPTCSTTYLQLNTSYSGIELDIYFIAITKYVTNPSTYGFGSEESESTGHPTMKRWFGIPGMRYW